MKATPLRTVLALLLVFVLAACTAPTGPNQAANPQQPAPGQPAPGNVAVDPRTTGDAPTDPARSLTIVAGSEQQSVLANVVLPWCRDRGYSCSWSLLGSVDQARLLQSGSFDNDAFWFASSVFSQMGNTNGNLRDAEPMFLTPIVFAAKPEVLTRLGLTGDATAQQVMDATESGKARVWATNPTQSNSGATVLFSFLNFVAGNPPGQALTMEQLASPQVVDGMQRFFGALDQTPPSTGTMTNLCVEQPDQCEAMFTYEDLVIEKNLELTRAGQEPFHVIYPRGALGISDAPLGFVDHGQPGADAKYQIFTELKSYLTSDPDAQARLLAMGRRPAAGIGLSIADPDTRVFNPDWGIQATIREQGITFPQADVIARALDGYHGQLRRPVSVYYCRDGSGSMKGNEGWAGVQQAATALFDPAESARNLLQTAAGDTTTVAVFNSGRAAGPWTVEGNADAELTRLKDQVQRHRPGGGTNMYGCLADAVTALKDDQRKRLIVVMSDGQSERHRVDSTVQALQAADVPVIAIAFGDDADPEQLREVAQASGGAFVQKSDMVAALREAAGYK